MQRITTARRLFTRILFNKDTTEALRDALGWYHANITTDERQADLGPLHDWSSHAADAFGLMAIDYQEPSLTTREVVRSRYGTMA